MIGKERVAVLLVKGGSQEVAPLVKAGKSLVAAHPVKVERSLAAAQVLAALLKGAHSTWENIISMRNQDQACH